jgi:hypothetical protein
MAVCLSAPPVMAAGDEAAVVGRITEIVGGELLRYDPDAGEWIALVPDSPFGMDDALYTDERARAEILIPNGTLLRLDHDTRMLSVFLQPRLTHLQLAEGRLRVVSRADGADIDVQTNYGWIRVPSGAAADIAVDAQHATVTAVDGIVEALGQNGDSYRLQPGESLALTGSRVASVATVSPIAWTEWNRARDRIWAARKGSADSSRYLPAPLAPYAYELDAYGEWRRVSYSGGHHWLWHPTRVAVGWSPFTHGRWVTWYGDPCWIPAEPFGYVTHHYGSWEFLGGRWFWVPPNLGIGISLRYGWYPGRVGWVSSGGFIGWYPLLWNEPWYARRHWGLHSYPYARYRHGRHHHVHQAVVVPHKYFYHSRSYAGHRHRHVAAHRFQPKRGPHELDFLRRDRRRFYTKGTPAVRIPHPSVTKVVRQRIETKRHRPELFRPSVAGKHAPPTRRTAIGGPHSHPHSKFEAKPKAPPTRIAPSGRPNRLPHRKIEPADRPHRLPPRKGESPGRPDRLDPRGTPEIQWRRGSHHSPNKNMKPMRPPRNRFEGKSSNSRHTASKTIEKTFRRDPGRIGPGRERSMKSPMPQRKGPSASASQKRSEIAGKVPGHRMQRSDMPSRRHQATPSKIEPRILTAPARPGMRKPEMSSASRGQPAPSLQRHPTGPSRSGRPERTHVIQSPQRPESKASVVSAPPRQRPSTSPRPRQIEAPRLHLKQPPAVSSPSPRQRMQHPATSHRHPGGRPPHRGGDGPRQGRTP